jgi:hypothetical protein
MRRRTKTKIPPETKKTSCPNAFFMPVLRELADKPRIPSDFEGAHRHAFRPSSGSGGGVMPNEHPRAARRLRFGLTVSNQLSTGPTASLTKHIHVKARRRQGHGMVWYGMPQTIRRNELRLLVPLADTTIYEMEQRR